MPKHRQNERIDWRRARTREGWRPEWKPPRMPWRMAKHIGRARFDARLKERTEAAFVRVLGYVPALKGWAVKRKSAHPAKLSQLHKVAKVKR